MLKHLFKLIWNKRKQNVLFLSEILVSFAVIFAVMSMLVNYYLNYSKPSGIEYERVWSVSYRNPLKTENRDSLSLFYENIRRALKAMPQVREVTYSSANFPYSGSVSTTGFSYKGNNLNPINTYMVEDDYQKVLGMKLVEGRWFNSDQDRLNAVKPMVINTSLKRAMFGDDAAAGKTVQADDEKERWKIIGVVEDVKADGDYRPTGPAFYRKIDTASFSWLGNLLIKVGPDADAAFESKMSKLLSSMMQNTDLEIRHMDEMRDSKNGETIIPVIIFMTVAGFLIFNVALGLFGVLWYNISQRRAEIGLRMAIGASSGSISGQLVSESLLLASLSLVVGTFFAIQFPLLSVFNVPAGVYLIALLLSILFIYLLVIFCAFYPGRQAAAIHPAIALHEE
ncbi:ABC transporter permease [Pedobacter sp. JY14-1]|uniref:ABC transporter permease n=1 Tax=Pedobacter sp. JY14-1 TaxID=3034151 RepID=UPI0023E29D14|nr:ABC transporter permease [Pedobacter sp. JY14-1]